MLTALYALTTTIAVLSALALLAGGALVLLGRFCALSNVSEAERPRPRSLPRRTHADDEDPIEGLADHDEVERVLSREESRRIDRLVGLA